MRPRNRHSIAELTYTQPRGRARTHELTLTIARTHKHKLVTVPHTHYADRCSAADATWCAGRWALTTDADLELRLLGVEGNRLFGR